MQKKFLNFIKTLCSQIIVLNLLLLSSCVLSGIEDEYKDRNIEKDTYFSRVHEVRCTPRGKVERYRAGDLPCTRDYIEVGKNEKLLVRFKITNRESKDVYEHGYQELLRYKKGKLTERVKLRRNEDAYWSEVPFVRIRKQVYLADLDGDGYKEFAVYPFSSGSAIWGTVRIFSLKDKIEFWGEGRYQFEGDTFVQLGCIRCSKFNPAECKKCR